MKKYKKTVGSQNMLSTNLKRLNRLLSQEVRIGPNIFLNVFALGDGLFQSIIQAYLKRKMLYLYTPYWDVHLIILETFTKKLIIFSIVLKNHLCGK